MESNVKLVLRAVTDGYQRSDDIADATGINQDHVSAYLAKLSKQKLIVKIGQARGESPSRKFSLYRRATGEDNV